MPSIITFIVTEIEPKTGKILDIGGVKNDGSTFHSNSLAGFIQFLSRSDYICGHNILNHDLKYIQSALERVGIQLSPVVDTLRLSPLLFSAKPYHALVKDDKLQTDDLNNPLNDAIKAKDLFFDEVAAFQQADSVLREIYYALLKDTKEFGSFFRFLAYPKNISHQGNQPSQESSIDPEKIDQGEVPDTAM